MRTWAWCRGGAVRVQVAAQLLGLAALVLAPAGCASLDAVNPVTWWHDLEGGPIAEARPPPPNADAPYRDLGSAPTEVPPADAGARSQVADALVADRANAQYADAVDPLALPPPARARPPLPPGAVSADTSNVSLAAAAAPPPVAPIPSSRAPSTRAAPVAAVAASPLPPAGGAPAAAAEPAVLPAVPVAPPGAPTLAGVPPDTVPSPPPVAPPAPSTPAALVVGAPVSIGFAAGSSELPGAALAPLRLLARSRASGRIAITGYGDAGSAEPPAQQTALPLALARARAVAANLLASGVPSEALRINAEAQGSGAVARLVN